MVIIYTHFIKILDGTKLDFSSILFPSVNNNKDESILSPFYSTGSTVSIRLVKPLSSSLDKLRLKAEKVRIASEVIDLDILYILTLLSYVIFSGSALSSHIRSRFFLRQGRRWSILLLRLICPSIIHLYAIYKYKSYIAFDINNSWEPGLRPRISARKTTWLSSP